MKNKRVVLDTNLWVSFLISNRLKELDLLLKIEFITLVFSEELLGEFLKVSHRPKFKKFFGATDIEALLRQIHTFGELIKVTSNVDQCRDQKDNFLLNLAIDGRADFLITGDADLSVLGKINETRIISWAECVLK